VLAVSVLGPLVVTRAGAAVRLPAGKSTEVFVRLALEAGQAVPAARLIDDIWADGGGGSPARLNTLQSKISQLRRALGDGDLISVGPDGYRLDVAPDAVDAIQVLDLARATGQARRRGDLVAAARLADQSLASFGDPLLPAAGDAQWVATHRSRLEELRLGLLEDRAAAMAELAPGSDVIAELTSLLERYPLREGLWHALITAHYRAGRQADALATFQRARRTLLEEIGVEPGPALRELESRVLRQSADLEPARPGNLPALTSALVGRDGELGELVRLVGSGRLTTITGPAGVGKTRLAIEAARAFALPGGAWLVRLDALEPTDDVDQARRFVGQALGLTSDQSLSERFAALESLVVLDNCEHVLDAASGLIEQLLDGAPRLTILVTSQRVLGLDGERVSILAPLGLGAAAELFGERAAAIRPGFALGADNAADIAEICQALDGLPLAIELAAARARSLSVADICRRLDDRFALLQDPTSRRPDRRRALAAAIGWSYDLLFPDDQRGLWAIACFAGGATLPAVERVLGGLGVPESVAVDVVARLIDRCLVTAEVRADGTMRYRLLDSIAEFARRELIAAGRLAAARAAHADWFAEQAAECAVAVRGPGQASCVAFVRAEHADIEAALSWANEHDPGVAVRIVNGLGWTWVVLGDGGAAAGRVRTAVVAAAASLDPHTEAVSRLLAGWLEASAGNVALAETDLDRAAELADELGDDGLRGDVHRHRAFLGLMQGRAGDAGDHARAAAALHRERGESWAWGGSELLAASAAMMAGDFAEAARAADTAIALIEPVDDAWVLVHAAAIRAAIAQAGHDFAGAADALNLAAGSAERLGFVGQAAYHLTRLGRVEHQAGRLTAELTLLRGLDAAERSGDARMAATARLQLARLYWTSGRRDEAHGAARAADRWFQEHGGGDGAALAVALRAIIADEAAERLADLRAAADAAGDSEAAVLLTDALAHRAVRQGDGESAAALLAEADATAGAVLALVDAVDRIDAHAVREFLAAATTRDGVPGAG
jgi:predicted ATPase/DNA-binding SARP family transcriptional activator